VEEKISMCGLSCHECGAYQAAMADDDAKRAETAREWSVQFGADILPDEINCTGCLSTEDPLFKHCTVCQVRTCGMGKDLQNCGYCDEYPCDNLGMIHEHVPDAKERLDAIRSQA